MSDRANTSAASAAMRAPAALVGGVVKTNRCPTAALDEHLVTGVRKLRDTGRRQADAILVILDFLRNADAHDPLLRGNGRRRAW
jgi:hypothetical protein